MTCKDCIHYEICKDDCESGYLFESENGDFCDDDCEHFKNKADFVEVAWIDVNDRLPEKNGNYLCAMLDDIVAPFVVMHQFYNGKFIMQEWFIENVGRRVTHWMPLPEPPTVNYESSKTERK